MKFVCERCHTKYSIADEKVRGKVLKVRCKGCENVITVRESGASIDDGPASPEVRAGAPILPARSGNLASGGFAKVGGGGPDDSGAVTRATTAWGGAPAPVASAAPAVARGPAPRPSPLPAAALAAPGAPAAAPPPRRPTPAIAVAPPAADDGVEWYLAVDGAQTGPFTRAKLVDKILAQNAAADVHIWTADFDGWKPPKDVRDVQAELVRRRRPAPMPGPPPPPPAASRRPSQGMPIVQAEPMLSPMAAAAVARPAIAEPKHEPRPAARAPGNKTNGIPATNGAGAPEAADGLEAALNLDAGAHDAGAGLPPSPAQKAAAPLAARALDPLDTGTATPAPLGSVAARSGAFAAPAASAAAASSSVAMPAAVPGPAGARSRQTKLILGALGLVVVVCGVVAVSILRKPQPGPVAAEGAARETKPTAPDFAGLAEKLAKEEAESAKVKTPPPVEPPSIEQVGRPEPTKRGGGRASTPARKAAPTSPPPLGTGPKPTAAQLAEASRFVDSTNREIRVPTSTGGVPRATSPTQADIMRVVKANQQGVNTCYQRALLRDNTLTHGKINIRASIGLSGKVKKVSLDAPAPFRALEPCIRDVMSRWAFPPASEEYDTEFPVLLQAN